MLKVKRFEPKIKDLTETQQTIISLLQHNVDITEDLEGCWQGHNKVSERDLQKLEKLGYIQQIVKQNTRLRQFRHYVPTTKGRRVLVCLDLVEV